MTKNEEGLCSVCRYSACNIIMMKAWHGIYGKQCLPIYENGVNVISKSISQCRQHSGIMNNIIIMKATKKEREEK